MNNDEFVSVRIKKTVRAKARRLAASLTKEAGKQVKLHEAFDYQFKK